MDIRNPEMAPAPVRDAMAAQTPLRVEVEAGPSFELLIGLYATGTPTAERDESWAPASGDCPPDHAQR